MVFGKDTLGLTVEMRTRVARPQVSSVAALTSDHQFSSSDSRD